MTRQLVMSDPMVIIERDGWVFRRVFVDDVEIPNVSRVTIIQDRSEGQYVELRIEARAVITDRALRPAMADDELTPDEFARTEARLIEIARG